MEGFFYRADVAFATSITPATAHGVPIEALIPLSEPVRKEDGTYTERVSETTPIPARTSISPEGVIPTAAQTEATSPVLPLVISTSDPFAAPSQAVKDGFSLVVIPSSIPNSAIRGLDADLFSEESEEILEDPEDEPVLKKRISDSDKEESAPLKTEFIGMCPSFFSFFLPSSLFFSYVSALLLAVVSLLFVCLFPCLQRPLKG